MNVSGNVLDDDGKPVANVRIWSYGEGQPHRQASTDKEGQFTIAGVCAGRLDLQAEEHRERRRGSVTAEG